MSLACTRTRIQGPNGKMIFYHRCRGREECFYRKRQWNIRKGGASLLIFTVPIMAKISWFKHPEFPHCIIFPFRTLSERSPLKQPSMALSHFKSANEVSEQKKSTPGLSDPSETLHPFNKLGQ